MQKSEIRNSTITKLTDKVYKKNYDKYLNKIIISKLRGFAEQEITFNFPVTAIIGPNGSGKSTVLGAAGCAYKIIKPGMFFSKSSIGDNSMAEWKIEYELTDKHLNARQSIKRGCNFRQAKWARSEVVERSVLYFGIERTVPAGEKTKFNPLKNSKYHHANPMNSILPIVAEKIGHVLGKQVNKFNSTKLKNDEKFFVGEHNGNTYSEFHFGAGESSIIRIIDAIENSDHNSIVLIEEVENGLHPVATRRMVEYLIDIAEKKSLQIIFTTHSDYALEPLPSHAIWACIDGKLQEGKLSIETLRAVTGRIEKQLAIFVEDAFAKHWVESILRTKIHNSLDVLEIHAVGGDGNAVNVHLAQKNNPAVDFKSLCILDGDSKQKEGDGIYRLPGEQPELTVYNSVLEDIDNNIAILTARLQVELSRQEFVTSCAKKISITCLDPHLLFTQLGTELGFIAENIVRGAFFGVWIDQHSETCEELAQKIRDVLQINPANNHR